MVVPSDMGGPTEGEPGKGEDKPLVPALLQSHSFPLLSVTVLPET
jgi:hypothetical protein